MTTSTSTLTHDPRRIHAHDDDVHPGEIAVGVLIGRASEFFDFFVYAIASVVVFPKLVFPFVDPLTGTLYSFGIFALAFVARPFGTTLFMAIDRQHGRGAKLISALFLLGTSTVVIAFLPSYDSLGPAVIWLLAALRIGQGIAWGGTWDGLAPLLAITAPEGRRGWFAMLPQLGAPIGLIIASALFAFFLGSLTAADFLSWGWRYPFFVAFAINVVALFARLRMAVTPEYKKLFESGDLEPQRVSDTVRAEGKGILVGAFAPLATFALFHMVTVFPLSWVFLFTPERPTRFLLIEAMAAFCGLIAVVVSGTVADRIGRRTLLGGSALAIAIFSGFAPLLLAGGVVGETVFMVLAFSLLGISFGQSSGVVATNFAPRFRYTASALTNDLAWLFGAGFAPLVALLLSSHFGLGASGAYLLSGALCTLLALRFNRNLELAAAG
ncbi:MFS transporter [Ancylobacter mangrovi]|uniref:MFS transporter n=1 Tax=Ancylobacter mangrovi TaxID=2972472 RepID=A0A9X2PE70_9HYPH|nr:MFS transporter [Ancylobacter mangrovi]MCS0495739.1 MFS transporter [Ancylobacter mangrovi]MCS0502822.1 MFS transporter [Ancylobacter mangrovi]